MAPLTDYPEWFLGKLLTPIKHNDRDLFCKSPAFKNFPEPNIKVEAPQVGPSFSKLGKEYSAWGEGLIPELTWTLDGIDPEKVKEYLIVIEDPDAPLGRAFLHGIYANVPASRTSIEPSDLEFDRKEGEKNIVKSGFTICKNTPKTIWMPCRPPLGNGPHRYFFQVIALSDPLDLTHASEIPSKAELKKLVQGKVIGWGQWIGVFHSRWGRHKK